MAYQFGVLGPLLVRHDGMPKRLVRVKPRILLALLLVNANHPVGIDRLTAELWENPPRSAHANIYSYLAELRRLINEEARIITHRHCYELRLDDDELDLARYQVLVERADVALGEAKPAEAVDLYAEADNLWRGSAFDGLRECPTLAALATTMEARRLTATESCADARLLLGPDPDLVADLRRHLAVHPLREHAWATLIRANAAAGNIEEALRSYQAVRNTLINELGVEPGPELRGLHTAVLNRDPALEAAATAHLGNHKHPLPAQLPTDIAGFAGRHDHLLRLTTLLDAEASTHSAVVIIAIAGTAGVGKTALAVHWAHRIRHRYPDGQLYINLRGFDPATSIVTPERAIHHFLESLGVLPRSIPADLETCSALYRSVLADRRILVVLDNARDPGQVRPLLPGTPNCLVVVTSRNRLSGLVATEGAHAVALDLFTHDEARQLLAYRLGAERVCAEPRAVDEFITRCARLPLALTMAAARATLNPRFALQALAQEHLDISERLDVLGEKNDPTANIRAVFSWSYNALTPDAARLFRLLGIHPGPDISAPAAASLAGLPVARVRPLLHELCQNHLIVANVPDRYAFHDLLRVYAAEQATNTDAAAQRRAAVLRLLDHYLHTAHAADCVLNPYRPPIALTTAPQPGVTPETVASRDQAMAWFTAEHPVLLAALNQAAGAGFDTHTWQLAGTIALFLGRRGHWHHGASTARMALAAAQRIGDIVAQAHAQRNLGVIEARLGQFDDACDRLRNAISLSRQTGNRALEAYTNRNLAFLRGQQGSYPDALAHAEQALIWFRAADDPVGQALTLNSIGWYHIHLGHHQRAIAYCGQALAICQQHDYRKGQSNTWDSLGYAYHHLGDFAQAVACYNEALTRFREIGDRYDEADTLIRLGATQQAAGDRAAAHDAWRQALIILQDLGHCRAETVRAKLAVLSTPQSRG